MFFFSLPLTFSSRRRRRRRRPTFAVSRLACFVPACCCSLSCARWARLQARPRLYQGELEFFLCLAGESRGSLHLVLVHFALLFSALSLFFAFPRPPPSLPAASFGNESFFFLLERVFRASSPLRAPLSMRLVVSDRSRGLAGFVCWASSTVEGIDLSESQMTRWLAKKGESRGRERERERERERKQEKESNFPPSTFRLPPLRRPRCCSLRPSRRPSSPRSGVAPPFSRHRASWKASRR